MGTDIRAVEPQSELGALHGAPLSLRALGKTFGDGTVAVHDLDLEIEEGEFFALLGPSGCGKTTTMRMIAGFEAPTSGKIYIGDDEATGIVPADRNTGMVFQSYALFPHYDVFMNVAYGLIMDYLYGKDVKQRLQAVAALARGRSARHRPDIKEKVEVALEQVALTGYQDRRISELSGGQQQRVALARALVKGPQVLLMDEPLSNLDKKLRINMRATIREMQQRLGITAIFVTHDQEEAMGLADRVGVMKDGAIVQVGSPTEVYGAPSSAWTADFVGNSNLLRGRITSNRGDEAKVLVEESELLAQNPERLEEGNECTILVRPENIELTSPDQASADEKSGGNVLDVQIRTRAFLGASVQYTVGSSIGALLIDAQFTGEEGLLAEGSNGRLHIAPTAARILPLEEEDAEL